MSTKISYKLKTSLEGALAGGGDPATSPLYVFGPFLALIVSAGVAVTTFGASIWLAVITVFSVSAMYRLVMKWVVDGSGGSGLCEEEFGSWAVKINAGITITEYVLTFLVSVAALVTFIADRLPVIKSDLGGISFKVILALCFTLLVGFLVNKGPKFTAKCFGPATGAVLLLLWVMIISVVLQRGLELPNFDLDAFSNKNIHFTLGGYARILALMTGIEIFANLVASYDGNVHEKSRKAFGSLLIVMGTTVLTMIIVGPAIFALADPLNHEVSVFTQTMDKILPQPISYVGTLIGIAVLLSAAAASAQGVQNLCLGLRSRHYIPAIWGQRNNYDVPDLPVWVLTGFVCLCFIAFGTKEETYLSLYAAGVFILLSMTGWAATKRLFTVIKTSKTQKPVIDFFLASLSAGLATIATLIIFEERFMEGAWIYLLVVPFSYWVFNYFKKRLGAPLDIHERLRVVLNASPIMALASRTPQKTYSINKILVPLDGSMEAELAVDMAHIVARQCRSRVSLVTSLYKNTTDFAKEAEAKKYLELVKNQISSSEVIVDHRIEKYDPVNMIRQISTEENYDLIVMTTFGKSPAERYLYSPVTYRVIFEMTPPLIIVRPTKNWQSRKSEFKKVLVPLDGSEIAEQVLPYVSSLALLFHSEVILLSVPEEDGNEELKESLEKYLSQLVNTFSLSGINASYQVTGSGPSRTILSVAEEAEADLIALTSHGSGGVKRQEYVKLGSVVDKVTADTNCPIFFVSAFDSQNIETENQ